VRRLLLAAALLAAALAVAAWRLLPRDEAAPVSAAPAGRGVFVYETAGFEEIDAFGGARHDYPARTAITVRRTAAGCDVFRWRPLEGRIYEWESCAGDLRRFTEVHRFFGRDDRRTYRCDAGSSLETGWSCSAGRTTETAQLDEAAAGRIRLRTVLSGETTGSGRRELRLRDDGIPLLLVVENESATPSFVGPVRYRERYELRLVAPSRG
jgi:hypothetical protein